MRFFASLLLLGIATAVRLPVAAASAPPDSAPARTALPVPRIVIVEDPGAVSLFTPREDKILPLVQRGIQQLTGKPSASAAWASLVSPQDKVGIKVFSAPGPLSGTRTGVVAAVVRGLTEAGVPAGNIIIWDKQRADLVRAGYDELARRLGVRLAGSADAGYDDQVFYESALLGRLIWGDFDFLREPDKIGGRKSYVSKLVTQEMTKIINVTPLINHNFAGVTGHLYSLAMGSVDNSIRFEADPARLAMAVPEIYALHELGDRVVLNITDALLCQYEGEQRPLLHYSATLNQLRFSTDPVALDVLSLQDLDRYRPTKRGPEAKPIKELYANAALLELGANELNFIRVERP